MLNILWPIFIIISIIYSIFSGNLNNLNSAIFDATESAVTLTLTLIGTTCFWSGIMEVASNTYIVENLAKIFRSIIKRIFINLDSKNKSYNNIVMNIIANILGLGNAATPLGLKAMEELQKENNNKDTLSDNMMMLIVLNTASLQIIPTTVIAIRSSLGSQNPSKIIFPVWISTICAAFMAIIFCKIITPILTFLNFPGEVVPLALLRPISGSASMAIATDIIKNNGVDSFIGILASVIMGSTETTLYTIAVYTGSVKVKNTRGIIFAALAADFTGIMVSLLICRFMF